MPNQNNGQTPTQLGLRYINNQPTNEDEKGEYKVTDDELYRIIPPKFTTGGKKSKKRRRQSKKSRKSKKSKKSKKSRKSRR